jgi:hypothetical protein
MKKSTFAVKLHKINLTGFYSYQLNIEDSYLNAIKYGAIAGLISTLVIIAFTILFLL